MLVVDLSHAEIPSPEMVNPKHSRTIHMQNAFLIILSHPHTYTDNLEIPAKSSIGIDLASLWVVTCAFDLAF